MLYYAARLAMSILQQSIRDAKSILSRGCRRDKDSDNEDDEKTNNDNNDNEFPSTRDDGGVEKEGERDVEEEDLEEEESILGNRSFIKRSRKFSGGLFFKTRGIQTLTSIKPSVNARIVFSDGSGGGGGGGERGGSRQQSTQTDAEKRLSLAISGERTIFSCCLFCCLSLFLSVSVSVSVCQPVSN